MLSNTATDFDIELVPFSEVQNDEALKVTYLDWLNNEDVVKLIASPALLAPKYPDFIEESFARFTRKDSQGFFIWYKPENIFIGTAKLDAISEHTKSAWDGVMIGNREYHGRGLAAQIYQVLLSYAFNQLGLHRVNGGCNENNLPMIKTFKRAGYSLEGRLRQADRIDGEYSDHIYFGILRKEYFSKSES